MGRPQNSVERMLIVNVDTSGDCWMWKGPTSKNGYGKTTMAKKWVMPHRVFYEHYKGPITLGNQVDHLCKNKICVNPAHLEDVTPRQNTLRSNAVSAKNYRKTECNNGHILRGDNLYVTPDGRRQCKECRRQANHKYENKED